MVTSSRPSIPTLFVAGMLLAAVGVLMVALRWTDGQGPSTAGPDTAVAPGTAVQVRSDEGFALWGTDRHGKPLRWDACDTVRFVLNTADAPSGVEDDVRTALAMLAQASGLDLVLEDRTLERPDPRRPLVERDGDGWRWRPVLIAWARPGESELPLSALDRGVAIPVAVRDGDREALVTGQVVMNAARTDLVAGFGDRSDAIGATLLHELGHALGLDHVDDVTQIMSADPGAGAVRLGDGDLAGLRAVGAAAGCNPAPDPGSGRVLLGIP